MCVCWHLPRGIFALFVVLLYCVKFICPPPEARLLLWVTLDLAPCITQAQVRLLAPPSPGNVIRLATASFEVL